MSHGLILFPRSTPGGAVSAFNWWQEAAHNHGLHATIGFFEELTLTVGIEGKFEMRCNHRPINPEWVIMRGYADIPSKFWEMEGIPVVNSTESMQLSRNKMLTHGALSAAGIPTPPTIWAGSHISYAKATELLGTDKLVIKALQGSKGESVWLAEEEIEYDRICSKSDGEILIQKYIAESFGRDLRIWVIDGKAAGCVMRSSATDFRSNFSLGGKATLYDAPPEAIALAERAATTLGLFFAGVDLLFTSDGFTVCEVNGNAGFRTLSACGGPDILDIFFSRFNDYRRKI